MAAGPASSEWETVNPPAGGDGDWETLAPEKHGALYDFLTRAAVNTMAVPGIVKETAVGALKGAAKTGYNLADMTQRAATFGIGPHLPPNPINTTPTNTPQAVGQAAEQAAEYFIPGGAVSRGTKAIEGITSGIRGGRALAGLGRAALEGIGAGGVNLAQTGDPQSALKTAGIAGGASGVMQAAGALIPTPERIYLSALKPKKPLGVQSPQKIVEAQKAVAQTGIREGIPVSNYGLQRTQELTDQLNNEIAQKVAQKSGELGPVVQPKAVANRVEQLRPQFEKQVNPEADIAALEKSKAEFLRQHTPEPPAPAPASTLYGPDEKLLPAAPSAPPPTPTPMTLAESQAEKQGTYTQLRKKYGELGSAETEAQKALARGLKEEIVARAPELQKLNARDSSLIALENSLGDFVKRSNNHDLMSLKTAILGSALAGAGGVGEGYHTGGWTGAAEHGLVGAALGAALTNPAIKSRLAIAIDRAVGAGRAAVSVAPKVIAGVAQTPRMALGGIVVPKSGKWHHKAKKFAQKQAKQQPLIPVPSR